MDHSTVWPWIIGRLCLVRLSGLQLPGSSWRSLAVFPVLMGSGRVADGTISSTVGLEVGFDGGLMVLGLSDRTFSWPPWCLTGQLPLLHGFLLYLALSIASISELCASVCSSESSSAGLKLPAIARG